MTLVDHTSANNFLTTSEFLRTEPVKISAYCFQDSLTSVTSSVEQIKRYVLSLEVDDRLLLTGSVREKDAEIFSLIENRISVHDFTNGPLRVLEVGSGISLPLVSGIEGDNSIGDEGAPWFSRALKAHFGDKIEVTASDLQHESFQVSLNLYIEGQLALSCATTPSIKIPDNFNFELPYEAYAMRMPSFDKKLFCANRAPLSSIDLANTIDGCSLSRLKQCASSIGLDVKDPRIEFSLLPLIQVQMEKKLFGIEYRPGVDLLALGDNFASNSFDVVFGRHLFPVLEEERDRLANIGESIKSVIKFDGISHLQFDLSPEPLIISHRMAKL